MQKTFKERALEEFIRIQGGKCKICQEIKNLTLDHDHRCCKVGSACEKCVRGGLCHGCNMRLGQLESPLLKRSLDYLIGHRSASLSFEHAAILSSITSDETGLRLIGLVGAKGAGKDTVGAHLVKHHGFERRAFADSLKKACQIIFGLSDAQVNDPNEKEVPDPFWEKTPREILQKVGTEGIRNTIDKNVWVKSLFRSLPSRGRFVITDVRFENEAHEVRSRGGCVWLVERLGREGDGHVSEQLARKEHSWFDKVLINNKTPADLFHQVDEILNGDPCEKVSVNL